jgi:superfamily II DNA/RNA helicase
MDQPARMAALDQFRRNEVTLLVASDVAARGLDIPAVSHIFNFDVPHHPDDYVHRIGRTGRAGRSGTAITIVAPADRKGVAAIEKLIGQTIPWKGEAPRASEPTETSEHRKDDQRSGGRRGHRRQHRERRDATPVTPAPVTRLDEVRPRHAPKSRPAHADDGGHLPAFLLRPVRAKA